VVDFAAVPFLDSTAANAMSRVARLSRGHTSQVSRFMNIIAGPQRWCAERCLIYAAMLPWPVP
jgi:hypothetical protein